MNLKWRKWRMPLLRLIDPQLLYIFNASNPNILWVNGVLLKFSFYGEWVQLSLLSASPSTEILQFLSSFSFISSSSPSMPRVHCSWGILFGAECNLDSTLWNEFQERVSVKIVEEIHCTEALGAVWCKELEPDTWPGKAAGAEGMGGPLGCV